jgi:cold shock CspA family protein
MQFAAGKDFIGFLEQRNDAVFFHASTVQLPPF